jgi:threonine/homoserine/homoserine lactone efflux protein
MPLIALWKGITLGLGAAAPIGPVNVEIARRCLRGGFGAGFLLGCGAVTIDMAYLVLASLGVRLFLDWPKVMLFVGLAGALLLVYLGVSCLLTARQSMRMEIVASDGDRPTRNYVTGLLMTALNPMTLAFWFGVMAGQTAESRGRDVPIVCSGVGIGAVSWVCFFASLMSVAGRISKKVVMLSANIAGGLTLLGFAGFAIWRVLHGHL